MCGAFYIVNVDEMRPNFGPFAGVGISANPEHLPAPLELRCAVYISFFHPYSCSIVCFCVFVSRRRHELSDRLLPRINRDTWFAKPHSARIHAGTLFLYQIYRKTFFQHGTIVDAYNAPTKKIYIYSRHTKTHMWVFKVRAVQNIFQHQQSVYIDFFFVLQLRNVHLV